MSREHYFIMAHMKVTQKLFISFTFLWTEFYVRCEQENKDHNERVLNIESGPNNLTRESLSKKIILEEQVANQLLSAINGQVHSRYRRSVDENFEKNNEDENASELYRDGIDKMHLNIIKRPNDNRSIEAFTLINGLKLLLISDPKVKRAAVTLNVNVGSFNNPKSFQGLAHLLEHLIVFNNKKFKDFDELGKFAYEHGEVWTAATIKTNTNFFFSVPAIQFREALERLVALFDSPIFSEKMIQNELASVNKQFLEHFDNDERRIINVLKENANQTHPFSLFDAGNFESLTNSSLIDVTDLSQELIKFYDKHYSSNIMSVSVLSNEPIEKLKAMTIPLLKMIKNKNVTVQVWHENPFGYQQLKKKFSVVPIENVHKLQIMFPISDLKKYYKTKPWMYTFYLLNQNGKGSLLKYLEKQNFSESIFTTVENYSEFGFLCIHVDLTEKGIERVNEVIEAIFQYLNMIKGSEIEKWIFDEIYNLINNDLRFEKADEVEEAAQASSAMQDYPINEIFTIRNMNKEFQSHLIEQFLNIMNPEHMLAIIVSPTFAGKTNKREKWYGVEYSVENFEEEFLAKLKHTNSSEFQFPRRNEFIATNFELKESENNDTKPIVIKSNENLKLWFFQDFQFDARAFFAINFKSSSFHIEPLYTVCAELLTELIDIEFEEDMSKAEVAGIKFGHNVFTYGISFYAHGYSDKISIFVLKIMDAISKFYFDEQNFIEIKSSYFKKLKRFKSSRFLLPLTIRTYADGILRGNKWLYEEEIAIEENLNFDLFKFVINKIFSNVFIECFAYGNVESNGTKSLANEIIRKFKLKSMLASSSQYVFKSQIRRLPDSTSFVFEVKNSFESENAILVYYQFGKKNFSENVKLKLLVKILDRSFYDSVYSKERSNSFLFFNTFSDGWDKIGITFFNQTSNLTAYADQRIEAFIQSFKLELENMTSDDFEKYRNELIAEEMNKEKRENLFSFAASFHKEIKYGTYVFNRRILTASEILKPTKEDVLKIVDDYLICGAEHRAKLAVIVGQYRKSTNSSHDLKLCSEATFVKMEKVDEFRLQLPLHS
ncbi:Insulin-degrading enzyme-like protein [Dinothrombium tinctorium]|uniref:Insulin-degrading enzyme-like protein n=1 Tax=Dinothrombium tinctorium TaxID=1965070 RepID=A0A3S3PRI7_9ACAR|nr:Insulin-degrading enzyme-like protein [Dinothrombium tinctorium]